MHTSLTLPTALPSLISRWRHFHRDRKELVSARLDRVFQARFLKVRKPSIKGLGPRLTGVQLLRRRDHDAVFSRWSAVACTIGARAKAAIGLNFCSRREKRIF